MTFAKWIETNKEAKHLLQPDLGVRSWGELNMNEKTAIWQHLVNRKWFSPTNRNLYFAVYSFAETHKARRYCNHLLSHGGPHMTSGLVESCCKQSAHMDAQHIFSTEHQDVVYELLSYYAETLSNLESKEDLQSFIEYFNDLSNQFGLDIILTDSAIIPRQDLKIINNIYEPTLRCLSEGKWSIVNRELGDAFVDYQKNTPDGFSACITHAVSAVQAFLQILVKEEIGKGDIAPLFAKAQKDGLIPNDPYSAKALKEIISVLMQERQSKSDSHPKEEYANEKTARLVLNLTMIFIQHCLQP